MVPFFRLRARPRWRWRRARWKFSQDLASAHRPRRPKKGGCAALIRPVAQPRCRLAWTVLPWLLPATSDRPVRREHSSARGQGARQWQAAHATAAAGWMRSQSPVRVGRARLGCGVDNAATRVATGNGWCAEECSRCRGPAFRAGAWVPELCHGPHRRERPTRFALVVVDRHGVLTFEPVRRDGGEAERATARPARLVTRRA